jgi:hypothetical protein
LNVEGEEVYNTYGEHSNSDLLHMYGFVELYPNNIFDSVEVPTKFFVEAMKALKNDPEPLIESKIAAMNEIGLVDEQASFIIGSDGILNEEESLHILQVFLCQKIIIFSSNSKFKYILIKFKIYSMPLDEFKDFEESEYELAEGEEWDQYSLLNGRIKTKKTLKIYFIFFLKNNFFY